MRKAIRLTVLALITLVIAACASAPRRSATLYDELGGRDGIAALVDGFLNRVADDYRIIDAFSGANIARLRRLLEEQFCAVSAGPCRYTGESMEESHRGMGDRLEALYGQQARSSRQLLQRRFLQGGPDPCSRRCQLRGTLRCGPG